MTYVTDARWLVSGYNGDRLLLTTEHMTDASKDIEVWVWQDRIAKGTATHAVVEDRAAHVKTTVR